MRTDIKIMQYVYPYGKTQLREIMSNKNNKTNMLDLFITGLSLISQGFI